MNLANWRDRDPSQAAGPLQHRPLVVLAAGRQLKSAGDVTRHRTRLDPNAVDKGSVWVPTWLSTPRALLAERLPGHQLPGRSAAQHVPPSPNRFSPDILWVSVLSLLFSPCSLLRE